MKTPKNYIRVCQGPTTATYLYYAPKIMAVEITHKPLKPVLFRKARRAGRRPFEGRLLNV